MIGEQQTDLNKRLAAIRRKISNTTNAIAEAGHSPALLESLARFEAEAADLSAQLASPVPDLDPAGLADLRLRLDDPDPAALQTLLRGLLARVIIDRDGPLVTGELIYYSPPG